MSPSALFDCSTRGHLQYGFNDATNHRGFNPPPFRGQFVRIPYDLGANDRPDDAVLRSISEMVVKSQVDCVLVVLTARRPECKVLSASFDDSRR